MALLACKMAAIPPLARVRLSAVIIRKHLGVADPDNDAARVKPIIDGIVAAGVIPTDTYRYVEWGGVAERRGAPGVELVIAEVE